MCGCMWPCPGRFEPAKRRISDAFVHSLLTKATGDDSNGRRGSVGQSEGRSGHRASVIAVRKRSTVFDDSDGDGEGVNALVRSSPPRVPSPLVAGKGGAEFMAAFEREDAEITRDCGELFRREQIKDMLERLALSNPEFSRSKILSP